MMSNCFKLFYLYQFGEFKVWWAPTAFKSKARALWDGPDIDKRLIPSFNLDLELDLEYNPDRGADPEHDYFAAYDVITPSWSQIYRILHSIQIIIFYSDPNLITTFLLGGGDDWVKSKPASWTPPGLFSA